MLQNEKKHQIRWWVTKEKQLQNKEQNTLQMLCHTQKGKSELTIENKFANNVLNTIALYQQTTKSYKTKGKIIITSTK